MASADPLAGLSPKTGTVTLDEAQAEIALGDEYRFYDAANARRIIVEAWDNPENDADGVLGIVMPEPDASGAQPWGAVVTWEPIGWVSAENARDADYDALMAQMQAEIREGNAQRRADGFSDAQLLGWAQRPEHDSVSETVTWARELTFFDEEPNTLHYDMRLLGRHGVLSMNVVGTMPQLGEIGSAARDLAERTRFMPGARYDDFDAESDEVAAYGVAGLVASGAGVVVAKNLGAFAVLAKFLQPLGIALLVLAAAMVIPFRRLLGRGKTSDDARR